MPRRNGPKREDPRPLGGGVGWARQESGDDGDWLVRDIPGSQAQKFYRCPGCDHEIRPGTPHVVAWAADDIGAADERRHWHTACWEARGRRGLNRR